MRLLIPFLLLTTSAFAQVQQTIEVHLVEVPVTVIDGNGDPVRGLTEKNFAIFDEGKPRRIVSFDVVDFAAPESVSAISPLNPVARRSFLILFDLGYGRPNSLQRAQKAARDFVQEALQPRDLAAVATIDFDGSYRLLTSFTSDRALIASAIDEPASFKGKDPLGISNHTVAFTAQAEPVGMTNLQAPCNEACQHEAAMARNAASMNEQQVRQRVEKHVDALAEIARTLESSVGRKQVVLLSEGVPTKILTGRDARDISEMNRQADRIVRGVWWSIGAETADADQDQRFGSASTLSLLDRMKEFFRRSDVVLHAIDIQGNRMQQTVSEGATVNSNEGLATLARVTGGTMFANANSVGDNFKRLLHQQEVVYVLGFQTTDNDRKFHSLKVKLNDAPRGSRAEYRDGYYPGMVAAPATLTDAQIIMNDIVQTGVHINAFAAAVPRGDRADVPVVVEIDGSDLANAAPLNAAARIAIYAFDESGVVRDRLYDTLAFDPAKIAGGIKYFGTLNLPPGTYAVKTLLRVANSGRRGYARANVRVPRSGDFGLVPFVVDEHPEQWVIVKGETHGQEAYPFLIDGDPMVPAVLPRVRKGEARKIVLFVQNGAPEELTLDAGPGVAALRMVKGEGTTKIIMEAAEIGANGLDVAVRKANERTLRAHIPVVVE